ncbi:hypothetical protein A2U01_0067368, partial [Trifolium medium]|nr:hypothetical protein [Trifolium medium]
EEAKDLKKMSLESLISNLRSHKMILNADAPQKKPKSVALLSTKTSSNALKANLVEIEEETSVDGMVKRKNWEMKILLCSQGSFNNGQS